MRQTAGVTILLIVFALTSAGAALAQSPAPPGSAAPAVPAAAGSPVPIADKTGAQLGTVTIKSIADPYADFDPSAPPPTDSRYVLLKVAFEAAEDQSLDAQPGGMVLQTRDGFIVYPSRVPRPATDKVPEIQAQQLAPGDRISGVIGYVVPKNREVARVIYRADNSRFLPLVETSASAAVPVGTAVPYSEADGVTRGTITIREIADPFTAFDPGGPPPEGQRYVMVTPVFEAGKDTQMREDAWAVVIVDDRGFAYGPTNVPRPQDAVMPGLDGQTLAPGDRVSGVVGYVVPQSAKVTTVLYAPANDHILTVATVP
jgi:hypothetical protein